MKKNLFLIIFIIFVIISFCIFIFNDKKNINSTNIKNNINIEIDKEKNLLIVKAQAIDKDINYQICAKGVSNIELCYNNECNNYNLNDSSILVDDKVLAGEVAYKKIFSYKVDENLEDNLLFYLK